MGPQHNCIVVGQLRIYQAIDPGPFGIVQGNVPGYAVHIGEFKHLRACFVSPIPMFRVAGKLSAPPSHVCHTASTLQRGWLEDPVMVKVPQAEREQG